MTNHKNIGGISIPALGLGTYGMGGGESKDTTHDSEDIEAIKYAISLGLTHIDTAEKYAEGHAEELVGRAMIGLPRADFFITTKVSPAHLNYDHMILACRQSLERLHTNYVDLYLIHWPNPDIPLHESIEALDFLLEEGLTRYIGVSNFSVELLQEAQSYTKNKIIANQVEYSLFHKEPEENGLLKYCQDNNVILTAYSPIGQGQVGLDKDKKLKELAAKYNKTPVQIALNYLISQQNVITIPKSSNKEHLKEIAGSLGWTLNPEDMNSLKS